MSLGNIFQLAKKIGSSTMVLIIVFMLAFDYLLKVTCPLSLIYSSQFIPLDQNLAARRIVAFLEDKENPDVIILGSSTILNPISRCDDYFEGKRTRYDYLYQLNRINNTPFARYFTNLLNQQFDTTFSVSNMAIAGSMVSDQSLFFKKILSTGKVPELVIYFACPRDFLDNQQSRIEQTPVYKVLADTSSFGELFQKGIHRTEIRDLLIGMAWHYYKVKADYRTLATILVTQFSGHPLTVYEAVQNRTLAAKQPVQNIKLKFLGADKPNFGPKINTLNDLEQYRQSYNPPNYSLFEKQKSYLANMLQLAQTQQVQVILVNMPLTAQNKQLLVPGLHRQYLNSMRSMCDSYGASFYNLDNGNYTLDDFEDSCHMNRQGGLKFFATLVNTLQQDKFALQLT